VAVANDGPRWCGGTVRGVCLAGLRAADGGPFGVTLRLLCDLTGRTAWGRPVLASEVS